MILQGICEREQHGLIVLSPTLFHNGRRVLFTNNYGGREVWAKIKAGLMPTHHLWGCLELVRMGYEVALAEGLPDFNPRRPLPHDLRLLRVATTWLRRDDIIYCGHNVMYWLPFLRRLRLLRRHFVSLLFAHEPLDFARDHSAIVALTPTAEVRARELSPGGKISHLGWGVDLPAFPVQPYAPRYFLHCGIAGRDFPTLNGATQQTRERVRIILSWPPKGLTWPDTVELFESGAGYNFTDKKISFHELLNQHYAGSMAVLITTIPDPRKEHALGFTNLIEALAMGKPIIHTRTGAVADEIDVEREGCGVAVPPSNANALAEAMNFIARNPERASAMARRSRELSEDRYNMKRFSTQLGDLFASL
jgi:glycosyltransferase involved in cell wall biosynthesis